MLAGARERLVSTRPVCTCDPEGISPCDKHPKTPDKPEDKPEDKPTPHWDVGRDTGRAGCRPYPDKLVDHAPEVQEETRQEVVRLRSLLAHLGVETCPDCQWWVAGAGDCPRCEGRGFMELEGSSIRAHPAHRKGMQQLAKGVWYDAERGWFNIDVELANDGPRAWEVLIGGPNQMQCTVAGFGATPAEAMQAAMDGLSKLEMIPGAPKGLEEKHGD